VTAMAIQPYLFFNGRTDEALEFYRKTLGAEIGMIMRFKDSPGGPPPGYTAPLDKVMHAEMHLNGSLVMASDGMEASGKPSFSGFSLTYEAKDEVDAKRRFEALAKEGTVQMPFGETFFAKAFGAVQDKFGLSWMVIAGAKEPK
jgi:PhnB protein